jgi:SAM-dependent methyltransferase
MTPGAAGSGVPPELKQAVVRHYEAQLRRFGPTPEGMDWKDAASQRLRFQILCEVCDLRGRSLHEIGCGAGHLLDYLRENGIAADYSGSDLSPAMVEAARRLHPGARFEQRDLLLEEPEPSYDVVVCSGLFHVSLGHAEPPWRRFVEETLRRMWSLCRVAIAFNRITDRVDWRVPTLHYSSPGETLDFCRRELGRFVTLRHDYPLHEYTVYVYREPHVG